MNTSGINPFDLKVLVKLDPAEEKIGSIIVPVSKQQEEKYATMKATYIARGANAHKDWGDVPKPTPGDHVLIAKYAGVTIKGDDGEDYRLCNDEDIVAGIA